MSKKTKAELETELEERKAAAASGTHIIGCTFNGSPSADVCDAVIQIALTMRAAAEALQGDSSPMLSIGVRNDADQ
jgi:hypothetical protein